MNKRLGDESRPQGDNIDKDYGNDYLKWKKWGSESFGNLTSSESSYFTAEIKKAKAIVAKGAQVLEVGFGNGSFLAYARRREWCVHGTEVNVGLVDAARQCGYDAIQADDLSHYQDHTFDLIVAFDVLEHIPQEQLSGFILGVKRILKNNGHFIVRFPNCDSPFGLHQQNGDITHRTNIGSGKARYFASQCGMEIVFLGAESKPVFCGGMRTVQRMIASPIKLLVDAFVGAIFLPKSNIAFCSVNLVMILRA